MQRVMNATQFLLVSLGVAAILGCHPMDDVAWSIEEYGTVSVSAPMLVPVEKVQGFAFDLDKTAEFYFKAPRVEGAIRMIQQRSLDVQFAMQVQIEELLGSLAELKKVKNAAKAEELQAKLTKQALALAALQQASLGAGGAAAIEANPLLKVGLDAVAQSLGISLDGDSGSDDADKEDDQGDVGPEEVPDNAAPDQTVDEVMEDAPADDAAPAATSNGEANDSATEEEKKEFKSLLPLKRPAQDVLTGKKFTDPLGAYDGPIDISPRQAISLAANDKMTQDLFKWFAHPNGYGKNKKAYFCMLTVSCQPGYWTKKNFAADVMVTTEYAKGGKLENALANRRKKNSNSNASTIFTPEPLSFPIESHARGGTGLARGNTPGPSTSESSGDFVTSSSEFYDNSSKKDPFLDNFRRPLVAAVYPMVDSQVLDLRHSQREQLASAISLALVGLGAQAEALIDDIRRLERDAQTRTAVTVGSAYSAGGYNFGFRIEPRFVAIENPGRFRGGPGNRLEATQFPAMVLVFADKDELSTSVGGTVKEGGYDQIVFNVESRWLPKDWLTGLFYRQSESKMLRRAHLLDEQRGRISGKRTRTIGSPNHPPFGDMGDLEYATLKRRRWALAAAGLGSTVAVALPSVDPKKELKVKNPCALYHGWDNATSTFVIEGTGFSESNIKGATIGNRNCAVTVLSSKAVAIAVDAWGDLTYPYYQSHPTPVNSNGYKGHPNYPSDKKHPRHLYCGSKCTCNSQKSSNAIPNKTHNYHAHNNAEIVLVTTSGPLSAGTVLFNWHYKMNQPKSRPSVSLERDNIGNIIGVKVTGEFAKATYLLEAIKEALKSGSNIDLKFDASGKIEASTKVK